MKKKFLSGKLFGKSNSRKKAQVDTHFAWIFILIAGAVILAFFFTVARKQSDVSAQKLAVTMATDFNAILSSASIAKGTSQIIHIPGQEFDFSCTESCDCAFSVTGIQRGFKDKIIFSQSKLYGSNLLLWALDWKNPFRVVNFLYATDDNTEYWFVLPPSGGSSNEIVKYLNKTLPENITAHFVSSTDSVKDNGFRKNRIVMVDSFKPPIDEPLTKPITSISGQTNPVPLLKRFKYGATGLRIDSSTGKLSFFTKKLISNEATFPAKTFEFVLGAIFADNFESYKCNADAAWERYQLVKKIYLARATALSNDEEMVARGCAALYNTAANKLSIGEPIDDTNEQLRLESCPMVY